MHFDNRKNISMLKYYSRKISHRKGRPMDLIDHVNETAKRQYSEQSNLVYLSAFFAYFAIIPLFMIVGNPTLIVFCLISMLSSGIAVILNRNARYGLASLIFITTMTIHTIVQVIILGLDGGFTYYFFNMSILIVFTKWKSIYKMLGVFLEITAFISVSIYALNNFPLTTIDLTMTIILHIMNLLLNIAGVANSANHYLLIAKKAQINLLEFAQTDYLTKLPNRAAFQHFTDKLKLDNTINIQNYAVIMIDIDHFKKVNDHFGHQVGDKVLIQIANHFESFRAQNDFLARYGGEEFVFIRYIDNEEELKVFAESLRKSVEDASFMIDGHQIQLTISLGVLFDQQKELLRMFPIDLVDELLYQAKREGRNKVIYSTSI